MEYIEFGDLAGFILGFEGNIAEQTARVIAMQLLEGLKIMHENGFCHRDLKPQVRSIGEFWAIATSGE